jgi:hypothetical protein
MLCGDAFGEKHAGADVRKPGEELPFPQNFLFYKYFFGIIYIFRKIKNIFILKTFLILS